MIVKAEDMHDKMREIVQKIPWKSKFFMKPLRNGQLYIKITTEIPSHLALMIDITSRMDEESYRIYHLINNLLFDELHFYSDTYSQFTVYNYMVHSRKVIVKNERRIYNRLKLAEEDL